MGLHDEFELAKSHILHQDPLPTVSQAIHKLVDDETRLQTEPLSIQTMVLATPAVVPQTVTPVFPSVNSPTSVSKGKGTNVRRHNNKKSLLICSFYKNKGHFVETCYTRQRILQNTTALTKFELSAMDSHSKSSPASSRSMADLQDMVNQVHQPSSSASNTALSTISGNSPTWLLDSACCNHMTSSPDVVPSHTSTYLHTLLLLSLPYTLQMVLLCMSLILVMSLHQPCLFPLFTRFPNSLIIFFLLDNSLNLVFL